MTAIVDIKGREILDGALDRFPNPALQQGSET